VGKSKMALGMRLGKESEDNAALSLTLRRTSQVGNHEAMNDDDSYGRSQYLTLTRKCRPG
jgi:hypothetical protein